MFWGMQFAPFSHKISLNEPISSISLILRKNGAKPHRHYFDGCFATLANPADCDLRCESKVKKIRHCESLPKARAKQSKILQLTQNLPPKFAF
ncbi:hypothetical protein [Helicobacter sp. 23-1045]